MASNAASSSRTTIEWNEIESLAYRRLWNKAIENIDRVLLNADLDLNRVLYNISGMTFEMLSDFSPILPGPYCQKLSLHLKRKNLALHRLLAKTTTSSINSTSNVGYILYWLQRSPQVLLELLESKKCSAETIVHRLLHQYSTDSKFTSRFIIHVITTAAMEDTQNTWEKSSSNWPEVTRRILKAFVSRSDTAHSLSSSLKFFRTRRQSNTSNEIKSATLLLQSFFNGLPDLPVEIALIAYTLSLEFSVNVTDSFVTSVVLKSSACTKNTLALNFLLTLLPVPDRKVSRTIRNLLNTNNYKRLAPFVHDITKANEIDDFIKRVFVPVRSAYWKARSRMLSRGKNRFDNIQSEANDVKIVAASPVHTRRNSLVDSPWAIDIRRAPEELSLDSRRHPAVLSDAPELTDLVVLSAAEVRNLITSLKKESSDNSEVDIYDLDSLVSNFKEAEVIKEGDNEGLQIWKVSHLEEQVCVLASCSDAYYKFDAVECVKFEDAIRTLHDITQQKKTDHITSSSTYKVANEELKEAYARFRKLCPKLLKNLERTKMILRGMILVETYGTNLKNEMIQTVFDNDNQKQPLLVKKTRLPVSNNNNNSDVIVRHVSLHQDHHSVVAVKKPSRKKGGSNIVTPEEVHGDDEDLTNNNGSISPEKKDSQSRFRKKNTERRSTIAALERLSSPSQKSSNNITKRASLRQKSSIATSPSRKQSSSTLGAVTTPSRKQSSTTITERSFPPKQSTITSSSPRKQSNITSSSPRKQNSTTTSPSPRKQSNIASSPSPRKQSNIASSPRKQSSSSTPSPRKQSGAITSASKQSTTTSPPSSRKQSGAIAAVKRASPRKESSVISTPSPRKQSSSAKAPETSSSTTAVTDRKTSLPSRKQSSTSSPLRKQRSTTSPLRKQSTSASPKSEEERLKSSRQATDSLSPKTKRISTVVEEEEEALLPKSHHLSTSVSASHLVTEKRDRLGSIKLLRHAHSTTTSSSPSDARRNTDLLKQSAIAIPPPPPVKCKYDFINGTTSHLEHYEYEGVRGSIPLLILLRSYTSSFPATLGTKVVKKKMITAGDLSLPLQIYNTEAFVYVPADCLQIVKPVVTLVTLTKDNIKVRVCETDHDRAKLFDILDPEWDLAARGINPSSSSLYKTRSELHSGLPASLTAKDSITNNCTLVVDWIRKRVTISNIQIQFYNIQYVGAGVDATQILLSQVKVPRKCCFHIKTQSGSSYSIKVSDERMQIHIRTLLCSTLKLIKLPQVLPEFKFTYEGFRNERVIDVMELLEVIRKKHLPIEFYPEEGKNLENSFLPVEVLQSSALPITLTLPKEIARAYGECLISPPPVITVSNIIEEAAAVMVSINNKESYNVSDKTRWQKHVMTSCSIGRTKELTEGLSLLKLGKKKVPMKRHVSFDFTSLVISWSGRELLGRSSSSAAMFLKSMRTSSLVAKVRKQSMKVASIKAGLPLGFVKTKYDDQIIDPHECFYVTETPEDILVCWQASSVKEAQEIVACISLCLYWKKHYSDFKI